MRTTEKWLVPDLVAEERGAGVGDAVFAAHEAVRLAVKLRQRCAEQDLSEQDLSERLEIRLHPAQLASFKRCAAKRGWKLARWTRAVLVGQSLRDDPL